jgi:hypothetical protein
VRTVVALLLVLLASPALAQDYPPELPPLVPPPVMTPFGFEMEELDAVPPLEADGEPVTIDFLCARLVGASDVCAAGMQRLQATLNNSGLGHITARLLGTMQSTYANSGDSAVDLARVKSQLDTYANDITDEAVRIGADCIVAITPIKDSCGIAYVTANVLSCVAVVSHGCISNSSFEHEVGHNAGLAHDQPNASNAGYGGTSYGWCPVVPETGLRCGHKDVMTYPSPCGGSRVARYSNPAQACPTHGTTPFGSSTANGTAAWRARAATMAAFRQPTEAPAAPGKPVPTLED